MNDEDMAVNDTAGEEASPDTTPVPEIEAPGEVTADDTTTAFVEPEAETETETESKKGASARIRELNAAKKAAEEKAQSLEERLAELTSPVGFQAQEPKLNDPQEPIAQPGEELTADEFEKRVLARADARTELRIRQSEAINRINTEASETLRAYPELDPESDSFNRELSDAVTEATEAYVKSNPYSASVKTFVGKLMKPYQGAVAKEVGQANENIAKQVSRAALRPTSVRKPEKTAADKTVEELEAELGMVHS